MISQWQLLSPDPYVVILFVVAASWVLVSFRRHESKSQSQPQNDSSSERWLCRTLFDIKSERFRIGLGELVSAVCPEKKDWVFVKNCRTDEIGWLPQSCLELAKESGAKMENARLKVMFKDHHFPVDCPPKPIAEGIIWCIFVFSPDGDFNEIPDLGNLKSHVAIVTLSQNSREVRVGGIERIDIQEKIAHKLDENDFLECFSFIHTRLHPQRLIVIINSAECPLPALSGQWNGEECPDWIPIEQTARLLERVHLRTPIALLILNTPRKANLFTLHLFHQCCSVLVAAQESAASRVFHSDVIKALLFCPDVSLEKLISAFLLSFKMVAFNCAAYPKAAIVIKSYLNLILSMLYVLRDCKRRVFYDKLFVLRDCSNGILVDEFVDILAFCSAAKASMPNLCILNELQRNVHTCVRNMVIKPKNTFSSGLKIRMPSGIHLAGSGAVFSQSDTYLPYLSDCYSFYDFLPRLQRRLAGKRSSFHGKTRNYAGIHHSA